MSKGHKCCQQKRTFKNAAKKGCIKARVPILRFSDGENSIICILWLLYFRL